MNHFGAHSKLHRDTLHRDFQVIVDHVLQIHDHKVNEGHRIEADQELAFLMDKTKVRWPNSRHNKFPAEAADLLPFREGNFIGWDDTLGWFAFAGVVIGTATTLYEMGLIEHKVRWGGDWDRDWNFKDQKFNDWPHFELYKP